MRSSILGADPDSPARFLRDHGLCDRYLEQSGVPHAVVRPNLFMQNIVENTIPSIGADGSFSTSTGTARISMIDTRDIAAAAARLLTESLGANRVFGLSGSDALSYDDVADRLSASLRRTITHVNVDDNAVRGALANAGLPEWLAGGLVELCADYRRSGSNGYAAQVTTTVEELTGRPPRTLDQLLAEHAAGAEPRRSRANKPAAP